MTVFFGWRVVGAAFVVALFGWGFGFYGPPVFLHALEERMPRWIVSLAATCHFLAGAALVSRMPALQARFGIALVVQAGAVLAAAGVLGWALADTPWQLFAATLLSGMGWACTGGAAINAIVAPWFARKRPMALGIAFNGASLAGVVLVPLWIGLIAWAGFPAAAAILGTAMILALGLVGAQYLSLSPAAMGLAPDGEAAATAPPRPAAGLGNPWRDRRFATLAAGNALCLFAQLGLVAHLVSLLAPVLGAAGAGLAMALATGCAMAGRALAGWLLRPGMSRRRVFAANALMQAGGVGLLAATANPALMLLAVAIFGFGIGNATTLPPLIAQQDFRDADVGRVVALLVATGQATYAFAPAAFGLLREVDALALFAGVVAAQVAAAILMLARGGGRQGAG